VGGGGGGGEGGPSIGVMKVGASPATTVGTTIAVGDAGAGGSAGNGGVSATPSRAGISRELYP